MGVTAHVVVDLGFGDSGKGKTVDYLVRELGSRLVVRFNGGAQAAHNVVTVDAHHVFSQWGSGTLAAPDVETLLTSDVAVHPIALESEAAHLESVGVASPYSRLLVAGDCYLTTPFHQALNCLREIRRGDGRHGSCGVGYGETVRLSQLGIGVRAADVFHPNEMRDKLEQVRLAVRDELLTWSDLDKVVRHQLGKKWHRVVFDLDSSSTTAKMFQAILSRVRVLDADQVDARLRGQTAPVVFEGAQGVLLDETYGFHPHTTWSTTTPKNARKYASCFDGTCVLGVTRAYPTRHGAGPFPTEDPELTNLLSDPRNPPNPWQGAMRWGWFHRSHFDYALDVCGRVDGLVVTHLDQVAKIGRWKCGDCVVSWVEQVLEIIGHRSPPVVIESYGPTAPQTVFRRE